MCPLEEAKAFRLDAIEEEISLLEKELSRDQQIGFCHNDLQYGNIMIDEETKSITIIVSVSVHLIANNTIYEFVNCISMPNLYAILLF